MSAQTENLRRNNKITVLGCTLTMLMPDVYDVEERGCPRGMICKSKTTEKWAATWNMVPYEGDSHYRYPSLKAAVQRLLDWEKESATRKTP